MKKIIVWALLLTLLLGAFAGCKKTETPTEPVEDYITAQAAMEYLKALYKSTDEATPTPRDYERYALIRVGGEPFEVVWTVDLEAIKIEPAENDMVKIDIDEQCQQDTPYVLTATITDKGGNSVSHSWNYIMPEAMDVGQILKDAYALADGESLPYEVTLTGKVTSIKTMYDPDYKNITVIMVVEGYEDYPIECYRLKGDGVDQLAIGNIITVTGTLKNYKGTIEFDSGCILESWEKGDAVDAPTDPLEIVKAAYALANGETLPYVATLTGKVIEIDTPYDPDYNNISVVMVVEGAEKYPITCYRLKGDGVDQIAVDDIITVMGIIKNYKGTIEFDTGCRLLDRISGGREAEKPSSDPKKIFADAKKLKSGEHLNYYATLTGKVIDIESPYDKEYNNITVVISVKGYESTPITCYRMKGTGVEKVARGDTITVKGIIENYNGTLEFGSGCTMLDRVSGGGVAKSETSNVKTIMTDAAKLKDGEHLDYYSSLTGKVIDIESPYDKEYDNITVVIEVKGYENMPITCYRLKSGAYQVSKIARGDTITVRGVLENYKGTLEYGSGCTLTKRVSGGGVAKSETSDVKTIMTDALKLADGEHLDYYATLTGKVVEIDSPYDKEYKNISVIMQVSGYENNPIICYRMKSGAYNVAKIAVGDTITVRGVLENYKGQLEFGSGCTLQKRVSGGGVAKPESSDAKAILADAKLLAEGEKLSYYANLTGKVTAIDSPYDKEYGNISVYVDFDGTEMLCYRLNGDGVDKIAVGDTITVRGVIENYKGDIQFGSGSTMTNRVSGGGVAKPESSDAKAILDDATKLAEGEKLTYYANLTGKVTVIDSPYDKEYGNISVYISVEVEGQGSYEMLCYRMKGADGQDVSQVCVGDTITVRGVIENYKGDIQFGTGSTMTNRVSGGGVAKPESSNAADILADAAQLAEGESLTYYANMTGKVTAIDSPYDKEYGNISVYVDFDGTEMLCYRMKGAEGQDVSQVCVDDIITVRGVIENYKGDIQFGTGSTMTNRVSGGGVAKPETSDLSTIWADAQQLASGESLTYFANVTGEVTKIKDYYSTQYGNISVYIDLENGENILCYRMKSGDADASKIRVGDTITVRGVIMNYNGAIQMGQGGTLEALVPGYNPGDNMTAEEIVDAAYALESGAELEGQYTLTGVISSVDEAYSSSYKNITVTMKVAGREDKPIKCYRLKSGAADASGLRVGDTITVTGSIINYNGTIEFTSGCVLDAVVKGELEPVEGVATVVIYNPANNKALSSVANGYYLTGADVTVSGSDVTGYGETEQWELIDNGNGSYSFNYGGLNLAMGSSFTSTPLGEVNDDWMVIDAGNGMYYIENIARTGYRLQWRAETSNFSAYQYDTTADAFKFAFYVVDGTLPEFEQYTGNVTMVPQMVTAPAANTAYKLYLKQENLNKTLYFAGEPISAQYPYYMKTTEDYTAATDVFVEAVEGGYRLYFMDGTTKMYFDMYQDGTHYSLRLTADPTSVFTFNTQYNTFTSYVVDTDCYMGTYSTNDTISCSKISYIGSSFASHLGVMVEDDGSSGSETGSSTGLVELEEGKAYNLKMVQGTLGKTLYLAGGLDGEYWATTEDASAAKEVYVEKDGEGYHFYYTDGTTKTYIEGYLNSSNKPRPKASTTATQLWTYNSEAGVFSVKMEDTEYYMGTYSEFATISLSSTWYITGSNAGNKGTTQFYVDFIEAGTGGSEGGSIDNSDFVDAPVAETAYKFGVYLPPLNNMNYYVDGTNGEKYLNTTTDVASAVDVYFMEYGSGYALYTMKDNTKYFIDIIPREDDNTKVRVVYKTADAQDPTIYQMNTEHKYLTATVNNVEYALGTYTNSSTGETYTTLSASLASYLSDTSKIGVSQFPAWFMEGDGSSGSGDGGNEGEITPTNPTTSGTFQKVTDVSEILAGGDFLIAANVGGTYYFLNNTTDTTYIPPVSGITVNGDQVIGEELPAWNITDAGNNRVYLYNTRYLYNSESAKLVLGDSAIGWELSENGETDTFMLRSSSDNARYIAHRKTYARFSSYNYESNSGSSDYAFYLILFKRVS